MRQYTDEEIELIDQWWVEKSRVNFMAYRQYMRCGDFQYNWFIAQLCSVLQNFYVSLTNGDRPIYVISTPPQHGKSWAISDFISWASGKNPKLRTIMASFSDHLGTRCNNHQQRFIESEKYRKIFPDISLSNKRGGAVRTSSHLEFLNGEGTEVTGGLFRNTTVGGPVTGESLDLGVIDDPIKGREQANSKTYKEKIWDWFTDDFGTRFSEYAGLLAIMTRWDVNDLVGKMIKEYKGQVKVFNFQALATKKEKHRDVDDPLFPQLKSKKFLMGRKSVMRDAYWDALYQGNPVIVGGNLFKDEHWEWWESLPLLDFKFMVGDTAQKVKTINDWTCFQCWGFSSKMQSIYLLDMFHDRLESPELRIQAELFYNKHNKPRKLRTDPVLRGFYIEDKSSGSGLIQELRRKKVKVVEVQRSTDKVFRSSDTIPEIKAGKVHLNINVPYVSELTSEGRQFPNGEFDDIIDTTMSAIEVAFIDKSVHNSLKAAMEADN
ncbi:MAG: phage terminase large subunit [bacterium]|nr:phage terminase large subunit [bacterium]